MRLATRWLATLAWCAFGAATTAAAQRGSPAGHVRLSGRVANGIDSLPVVGASIRLLPIDSTRMSLRMDDESATLFVDSARVRFTASDSLGMFRLNDLAPGRYLFQVRRIGFSPREVMLTADTPAVAVQVRLEPTSRLLSKVDIVETSVDRNGRYLKTIGFTFRQHGGLGGHFLTAGDIAAKRWIRGDELLLWEGLKYNPAVEVRIDGMPMRLDEVMNFPVDLIMAVEIYPDTRPLEFGGAQFSHRRPLVLIWTFRP